MAEYFIDPAALKAKTIGPGTEIRVAYGEKIMLSFVRIEAGGSVPLHNHPHEQGGMCLEGAMEMIIGGETRIVRKGDGYIIPGGVMHAVRALESGAYVLDIFYPHREEYK